MSASEPYAAFFAPPPEAFDLAPPPPAPPPANMAAAPKAPVAPAMPAMPATPMTFGMPQPAQPPQAAPPASTVPAGAAAVGIVAGGARTLLRKAELELAMLRNPADRALRTAYFEHLTQLAGSHTGLLIANLPDVPTPLYFRAGTPDIAVMAHYFRDDALVLDLAATPRQILVIGAYAGYLPVELARRFPHANILCAEPLADNFRLLSVNTTPWRRIRVAQVAVWHNPARLAALGRMQADWAVRLSDQALAADKPIPALPAGGLMARAGWNHAEMIVCDASGNEREVFADPLAPWLRFVDVALIRLYESNSPGATAAVEACFDPEVFERRKMSDMDLFTRRVPRLALPPTPPELMLLRNESALAPFQLRNTEAAAWAFFVFDGTSCQLHPNGPGRPAATAIFPVALDGHTKLTSGLLHAGNPGSPSVRFMATVQREDGSALAHEEVIVGTHESGVRMTLKLPGYSGPGRVMLQTEMAPGMPHNSMAWARWINPRLS
jgi:hypothetical protein